jgi:hypothetical protein
LPIYKRVKGFLYKILQIMYRIFLPKIIRVRIWEMRNSHV